ncbi:MAG: hypothetical protein ACHQF3_00345 [Alphaproteobacteria bacterium]
MSARSSLSHRPQAALGAFRLGIPLLAVLLSGAAGFAADDAPNKSAD